MGHDHILQMSHWFFTLDKNELNCIIITASFQHTFWDEDLETINLPWGGRPAETQREQALLNDTEI